MPGSLEPNALALSQSRPSSSRLCRAMLADQRADCADRAGWVYEIKHDGFRFICRRDGDGVRVFSRRGNDHTDRAPGIAEALMALKVKSVTIDGEGVVCGPDGVTDFNRLRAALGRKGSRQAFLYAFDLLELDGHDLRREPWETRRATLTSLLRKPVDGVRLCELSTAQTAMTVFWPCLPYGARGIVAKRRDRPYRSGRSPDWVKVKNPDATAATRTLDW